MDEPPSLLFASTFTLISGIGSLLFLLIFAALTTAGEAAIFSVLRTDLEKWKISSAIREKRAALLLADPVRLRMSLRLFNLLIKTSITALFISLFWRFYSENTIVIFVSAITIITVICFVELLPRLLAKKYRAFFSVNLAKILELIVKLCSPVVAITMTLRTQWNSRFKQRQPSYEELHQVLELANATTVEAEKEKEILRGIVNFGSLSVKDLMKSRESVSSISLDSNFTELIAQINDSGYSRIPVHRKTLDTIEGVLYTKDLLPFLENGKQFHWRGVLRPGFFVNENRKIDLLLKDFQEKRVHMAIVRDDKGATSGLITLEDLIEEIIREINDQPDQVSDLGYKKIDDNTFVFDGKTPILEFFKVLDQDHPFFREPGDHESLEDFIIEFNDELPFEGDELYYEQFTFVIEEVEQKRIKRVRVNVHEQA